MEILYIVNGITDDNVLNFIQEFNALKKDGDIIIYINSPGGDVSHAQVIIDIISKYDDKITLIASGILMSAAFNIFFFSKCKRKILADTVGMAHFAYADIRINQSGQAFDEMDKFYLTQMKKSKSVTLAKLQAIGLNKAELALINKNKDCYFTNERLNEILQYGKEN